METLKRGDLFKTSWGYDQTNYDFLAVLEVSKTGKTAKCQMTRPVKSGTDGTHDHLQAIFCPYGDTFTMRIKEGYRGDLQLKGSYPFCNDGKMENKRLDSFSRCEDGKIYYETNIMAGH